MKRKILRESLEYLKYIYPRRFHQPEKRFLIFGRGRSGSTLLVNLLDLHGQIKCDGEILHDPILLPRLYVHACAASCQANVYGFKLLSYQIRDVQKISRPEDFLMELHEIGYKIIYLSRSNLLRHSLSNINARRRKSFHYYADEEKKPDHSSFKVDALEVLEWIKRSESLKKYEQLLLKNVPCLNLVYEKHLLESSAHQATANLIFDFLGLSSVPVKTNLVKANPLCLKDMITNFDELADILTANGFDDFIRNDHG